MHSKVLRGMPIQYGKCSNRASCSLAYTGESIRFEGEPRCPECGQALAIQQRPRSAKAGIPILSGLLLLSLGAAGTGAWLYVRAHQGTPVPSPDSPHLLETETSQATSPPSGPAKEPAPDAEGPALIETNRLERRVGAGIWEMHIRIGLFAF